MILLDTNVISELRKPRPHGAVLAWYQQIPSASLYLSSVTIYELQAGAERTRVADRTKAAELDRWISGLEKRFAVLAFNAIEARVTAALMRNISLEHLEDAMIAATALASGFTVATRNTKDFERFGIAMVNPFLFRAAG